MRTVVRLILAVFRIVFPPPLAEKRTDNNWLLDQLSIRNFDTALKIRSRLHRAEPIDTANLRLEDLDYMILSAISLRIVARHVLDLEYEDGPPNGLF